MQTRRINFIILFIICKYNKKTIILCKHDRKNITFAATKTTDVYYMIRQKNFTDIKKALSLLYS